MSTRHGDIHWSELMTRDTAKARAYFEQTAGWTIEEMPMGDAEPPYLVCSANGQPVAGIMDMNAPEFDGIPPNWTTFIHVDDVDLACAQTTEAGGQVMRAPFDVPVAGRIAIVADPTGAVVALITPNDSQPQ
ncbi:MAG: VOC family protein [Pseudomonadota bacterium]